MLISEALSTVAHEPGSIRLRNKPQKSLKVFGPPGSWPSPALQHYHSGSGRKDAQNVNVARTDIDFWLRFLVFVDVCCFCRCVSLMSGRFLVFSWISCSFLWFSNILDGITGTTGILGLFRCFSWIVTVLFGFGARITGNGWNNKNNNPSGGQGVGN